MRKFKAFTIIELLIVVVIIGVIGAMSSGYFADTVKKTRLAKAANELAMAGKYARILAIDYHTTSKLCIGESSGEFYVSSKMPAQSDEAHAEIVVSNSYSRKTELPDGCVFEKINITPIAQNQNETEDNVVSFYPSGNCDLATIQIGDGERSYTISFERISGKYKITDGIIEHNLSKIVDLDMIED